MKTTINYFALFEQLKQFLPMLRANALQAIEYGDSATGRIHHRIEYSNAAGGPQFILRRIDANGQPKTGAIYLGDCRIERVITIAQDLIQDAHAPTIRQKFFARRKPQPAMQYFAY